MSAQLHTIQEKVDQNAAMHHKCREELPQKFATQEEFKEHRHKFKDWKEGRDEIWEALNNHSHDEKGRVASALVETPLEKAFRLSTETDTFKPFLVSKITEACQVDSCHLTGL
jgi:hypothetical protein